MPTLTVTSGGPDIDDGIYPMYLKKLEGPKTIVPQSGPNAGKDVEIFDWIWETAAGVEIAASTSTASGPRSKMFAWLTALHGGRPPQVGQQFQSEDLVGRWVLGTVRKDETGWARIVNLAGMPQDMQQRQFAQATGAPVQAEGAPAPAAATVSPIREAVAAEAESDALPF